MKNDGKRMKMSPRSRHGPAKKDGKHGPPVTSASSKKPSKYTIVRKPEDLSQLEKLRRILKDSYGQMRYNTDAEIYRDLPRLYLDAVKQSNDHAARCDDLTAELAQLGELKNAFCRCMELSQEDK